LKNDIRPISPKGHTELASQWDRLAEERHRQISSGEDLSFHYVVVPTTWKLLEGCDLSVVMDIGSGTGDFTARLARVAGKVIAIEPSAASMALARRVCQHSRNVRFLEAPLEEAALYHVNERATAAVAVMTLMTAPDLREFAKALAVLLEPDARFAATLTHPCFWPKYWGYADALWFHYNVETFIEAPFVISRCRTKFRTTHIHRPLEQYIKIFAEQGFQIEALMEPMPTDDVQTRYPAPWRFPRFLGLLWKKSG
jgi:FkbM family methyltransferase